MPANIHLSEKRLWWENNELTLNEQDITKSRHYRSAFHRDYDRIIFSNSFKRLAKKTQVHPLSKNDHVHNRMTHSLETASVGRSLGLIVGNTLPIGTYSKYDLATIIQAACLAHDIGNPPFGHAGEDVIKSWFRNENNEVYINDLAEAEKQDFQKFDGNAQSFRIVSQLENNPFQGGMQLTISTLATMVKYPWFSTETKGDKFNFFQSEKEIAFKIFNELGLENDKKLSRYPFSYLMEVSDDICYGLLDLQDAVELKIINPSDTYEIFKQLCTEDEFNKAKDKPTISQLCAYAVNNLAVHAGKVFESNKDNINAKDLIQLFIDERLKAGILDAKTFARDNIFTERRKIELELGAYHVLGTLLDNLIKTAYELHKNAPSYKSKRIIQMMGDNAPSANDTLYNKYRKVIDYIVGMTDNYATHIAHQLNGMAY